MSIRLGYEENKDASQINYLKVEEAEFENNNTKRRNKKYKPSHSMNEEAIDPPLKINIDENKLSSQQLLKIEGIDVYFPHNAYPAQIKYMEAVIKTLNSQNNALLQSPVGSGKILCLLCSILGWLKAERDKKNSNSRENMIRVIYTARNYSRLKQVIKELKTTCYMPSVSLMGTRDLLCIKPEFQHLKKNALDAACNQARHHTANEHRCAFYDKLEKNKAKLHQKYQDTILDLEDIHQIAKRNTFCPYYYLQQTQQEADIVLMPYIDLLDKNSRLNMEKNIKNAIIIFDDGHNIHSALEDGISFELSSRNLLDSETDIKLLQDKLKLFPEECKLDVRDLNLLSGVIRNLFKNFGKWRVKFMEEAKADVRIYEPSGEIKDKGKTWPGKEIFKIFKDLAVSKTFSLGLRE